MEARATIDPRSTPHRRRCTTTAVARRINTAVITTPHRATTRLNRVTTRRRAIISRHRATTRPDLALAIVPIRTRAGGIMVATAVVVMAGAPITEEAAAVTVDEAFTASGA